MARRRARVEHLEGADPAIGDDGLPTDPEPFFPRGWYGWVIVIAVVGCLVGGALVLAGVLP